MTKATYHHGDLKNTLIKVGLELLAEDGWQALSLRKVARRAGVSHNAPYMHFADKDALLDSIKEEGFKGLEGKLRRAITDTLEGSLERLRTVGRSYVGFALDHPQHFAVMFADLTSKDASVKEVSTATFTLLVETLESCQAAGLIRPGEPRELAAGLWALLHGLATLLITKRLAVARLEPATQAAYAEKFLELLYQGLRMES